MAENPYKDYPCPVCKKGPIETVVTAPYVRGFLLAYQIGSKKFVGCVGCARGELLKEVGLSLLVGWFSPTCIVLNPIFVVYNLVRSPFVGASPAAIEKAFIAAGIPLPGSAVDIPAILYAMAAAMISADGKVLPEEIDTAAAAGKRISATFDEAAMRAVVANFKALPDLQRQARVLANVLNDAGKQTVLRYLLEIATADGQLDRKEERLLNDIGSTLLGRKFKVAELNPALKAA